jgi:hypothetical protein
VGNYNPRAPILLGEEWVPIRGETITLPASDAPFEVGHRFTLAQSRTLDHACFYVDSFENLVGSTPQVANIYPAGAEARSGPIRSVIIPVNAALITGADITNSGASNIAEAVAKPSDGKRLSFVWNSAHAASQTAMLFFATNQYAQQLNGKRILAVNFLYAGYAVYSTTELPANVTGGASVGIYLSNPSTTVARSYNLLSDLPFYPTNSQVQTPSPIERAVLGELTDFNTGFGSASI